MWPIEQVWSILKERVKEVGIRNKAHLKSVIQQKWQESNGDKVLCKRLIKSIPKRLLAVIDADGRQITKGDYD